MEVRKMPDDPVNRRPTAAEVAKTLRNDNVASQVSLPKEIEKKVEVQSKQSEFILGFDWKREEDKTGQPQLPESDVARTLRSDKPADDSLAKTVDRRGGPEIGFDPLGPKGVEDRRSTGSQVERAAPPSLDPRTDWAKASDLVKGFVSEAVKQSPGETMKYLSVTNPGIGYSVAIKDLVETTKQIIGQYENALAARPSESRTSAFVKAVADNMNPLKEIINRYESHLAGPLPEERSSAFARAVIDTLNPLGDGKKADGAADRHEGANDYVGAGREYFNEYKALINFGESVVGMAEGAKDMAARVETAADPATSRTTTSDGGRRESVSKDGKVAQQADGRLATSSEGRGQLKSTLVGTDRAKFMRDAARLIRDTPGHPLEKLLDENGNFRTTRGLRHSELIDRPDLVQAGHTISDKAGGQRVVLQDAWDNQFSNVTVEHPGKGGVREFAYVQNEAIDIGGIGVEKETAKRLEREDIIPKGTVEAAKPIYTEAHGQSAPEDRTQVKADASKDSKLPEMKGEKVTDGKVDDNKATPIETRVRVQVPPESTQVRVEVARVRVQLSPEPESEENVVAGHDTTGRARMRAYRSQPDVKRADARDSKREDTKAAPREPRVPTKREVPAEAKLPDAKVTRANDGEPKSERGAPAEHLNAAPRDTKLPEVVEGSRATPVEPRVPGHQETSRDAPKETRLPEGRPATDNRGKRDGSQTPPIEPRVAAAPPVPNQVPEIKLPQP
jgi:hypothetical protein